MVFESVATFLRLSTASIFFKTIVRLACSLYLYVSPQNYNKQKTNCMHNHLYIFLIQALVISLWEFVLM